MDNLDPWEHLGVLGCCAAPCPSAAAGSGRDLLLHSKQQTKGGIRWKECRFLGKSLISWEL